MIELHCHLDGSLRYNTLRQLAHDQGIQLPDSNRSLFFYKGMSLYEALERFKITLSVLQTPRAITRVTSEICTDAEQVGVRNLEIRFAPQLHGSSIELAVDAAIQGLQYDSNLILCGLYGEPPEVLNKLVEVAKTRSRVVGIDLAGGPSSDHRWGMFDYIEPFEKAKRYGIGRTVHAAEGRSPKEIEVAINFLHAQRIGHGTTILEDPRVVDLVRQKGVVLEACITSNVHTGAVDSFEKHPIKEWIKQEIPVSICSDNTLMSNTDLSVEIINAMYKCGLTEKEIDKTYNWGREALFGR